MSHFSVIAGTFFWLLTLLCTPAAARTDFAHWLEGLEREALASGISAQTLRTHLEGLEPIPRIIELDQGQSGTRKGGRPSLQRYLARVVPDSRIRTARQKYQENRELLQQVGTRFGVDPQFIVALWAVESDFGRRTGSFPVVGALATLAHEGRRGDFFRGELLTILQLLDQGRIARSEIHGSWAGAMGQVQFMPSSFQNFATDFDGDGWPDLWNSVPDALASAANYLSVSGWQRGQGWGQKVRLPKGFKGKSDPDRMRTLKEWRKLGLKDVKGPDSRKAALVMPEGQGAPAYLVYANYRVLRQWNRSNFFAMSVCHLADRIAAAK
ncbi:lytic murein transglycosylase [Desulfuromonas versatilis]|uniref:lytic murein transglycosylase n=1 Tax=Desulfuromonas versatilis TaxID=2802975 RepID=UPI001CEC0C94|nr:lytic murein transglycosylase [Desulfuromonas versatilis]